MRAKPQTDIKMSVWLGKRHVRYTDSEHPGHVSDQHPPKVEKEASGTPTAPLEHLPFRVQASPVLGT